MYEPALVLEVLAWDANAMFAKGGWVHARCPFEAEHVDVCFEVLRSNNLGFQAKDDLLAIILQRNPRGREIEVVF